MKLGQAVKMAAKSIFSNVGRSVLTMLGIIIGLAAVIILVSYAQGQNAALKAYYESMGTNTVSVYAYSWGSSTDVGQALYDYCLGMGDKVAGVTPVGEVYRETRISYESKTLPSDDWNTRTTLCLGSDQFSMCREYTLARGRDLSFLDIKRSNQVCVIGSATAEDLFSFSDPIDKTISINGLPFRVIGVYQSKAAGITANSKDDMSQYMVESMKRQDRIIVLPYTMTRYFNDNQPIDQYTVKVKNADDISVVVTDLKGFLSGLIDTNRGGYGVDSPQTSINDQNEANAMQQRFLGGIAAISLLVGGIGIMNIMLVTVTERTREIGIRKAIGAERRSIIVQFLIEAAMICGIGGIFGILVGYVGTLIVGKLSFNIILVPSPAITVGAAAISIALGLIFGMYPAIKASGLQPVVALRAD